MLQIAGHHRGGCAGGGGKGRRRLGSLISEPALSVASEIDKSLAMAHDDGPCRMADVQRRLNVDVHYVRQYRLRLIAAALIYSTRGGYVAFALPYLREYLREHAASDLQIRRDRGRGPTPRQRLRHLPGPQYSLQQFQSRFPV